MLMTNTGFGNSRSHFLMFGSNRYGVQFVLFGCSHSSSSGSYCCRPGLFFKLVNFLEGNSFQYLLEQSHFNHLFSSLTSLSGLFWETFKGRAFKRFTLSVNC